MPDSITVAAPELRPVSRKIVARLLVALKARAKVNPAEMWKARTFMNGRGDYGYTETHYGPDGLVSHAFSIDGARQDVRWYLSTVSPFASLLN